jgi:hypothetical protein
MPMYVFGEEHNNPETIYSYDNKWVWNDRLLGTDINKFVQVAVGLVEDEGSRGIETTSDWYLYDTMIEKERIIQLGPLQLWLYVDSTWAAHPRSMRYFFGVNARVLTKDGTKQHKVISFQEIRFKSMEVAEKVYELLIPYAYIHKEREVGELTLDVAVHVADIGDMAQAETTSYSHCSCMTNEFMGWREPTITYSPHTNNVVVFDILNVKEYR